MTTNVQNVLITPKHQPPVAVEPKKDSIYKINFKAENDKFVRQTKSQPVYTQPPMLDPQVRINRALEEQKKAEKKQKSKNALTWGLGIAVSTVMLIYFGKLLHNEHMQKKAAQQMETVLREGLSGADGSLVETIRNCSDPVLRRAAANEFAKGPGLMSTKRIKDIISLSSLKDAKPEEVDLKKAMKILDEKIIGMDEVKDEILDFLVHWNYNIRNGIPNKKPLVLALDGPAGTGKTTISEVLAEALGMHYKKISLAGASGKAAIKGYEAVYTGASMGGIAQGQLEGGTRRVLYCLDEVEKSASSNYNGKVEDTLLSLFDDQAKFVDDNLDVPIDVSQSIFILTTNEFEKLSTPVKNRVKKISISPYGKEVKAKIAKLHLGKELKHNKIGEDLVKIEDSAYEALAELTSDQGGREATRNAQKLVDKIVAKIELGETNGEIITIDKKFVKEMLQKDGVTMKERVTEAIDSGRYVQKIAEEVAEMNPAVNNPTVNVVA